jgi:hypothetical protein
MSTDNLHDDAEFERFLAGEGELSRQLKGLPQAEPSAELDAAVFASIEAAMAAEKVQVVEPEPRGAANDPVGPTTISPQRRRSLAYYWHWPVGVAAGILLTLAYRTAFDPYHPPAVALNDSMQSRVISPTPHVIEQPDVISEPGRVATAPAVLEPPDVASQPASSPAAAAPAQPLVAAVSAKESAAPVVANAEGKKVQTVVVTGSTIMRRDAETASPVQVITASDLSASPDHRVADAPKQASGVELAWTRDPAQDAAAAKAASHAESPAPLAAAEPPPPPPAAAPVAMPAVPVREIAAKPELAARAELAAAAPAELKRTEPYTQGFSPQTIQGILDQPSAGYPAGANGPANVPQAPSFDVLGGNNGRLALQPPGEDDARGKSNAAKPDRAHADPRKWLARIEQEIKDKHDEAALAEWDSFVAAHPSYKVNYKLRAAIKALRDRQAPQPQAAGSK